MILVRDDNAGRAMQIGPQSASKKCVMGSLIQPVDPLKSVLHNLQFARANNEAGQAGLLIRKKKRKVYFPFYYESKIIFYFVRYIG